MSATVLGFSMIVLLAVCGLLLMLKMAGHSREQPPDHYLVLSIAVLAGAITYRFFDVMQNPETVRLSAVLVVSAVTLFLVRDRSARRRSRKDGRLEERRNPGRPDSDYPGH